MKCIRTHYVGPTDTKGARIVADDGDGNRITLSRDTAKNVDEQMRDAAYTLMGKMKWAGQLAGGTYKDAMYWCFVE